MERHRDIVVEKIDDAVLVGTRNTQIEKFTSWEAAKKKKNDELDDKEFKMHMSSFIEFIGLFGGFITGAVEIANKGFNADFRLTIASFAVAGIVAIGDSAYDEDLKSTKDQLSAIEEHINSSK